MDMAQAGMSKKGSLLLEKKDAGNEDLIAIRKEAEKSSTMMDMETLVSEELREYLSQNKATLTSKVKATLMKVGKILRKAKPRKKRTTTLYPILASALKFHKDDDMDDAVNGSGCRN